MNVLEKYKKLIIDGEYFEAHEVLEEEWHKVRKTDDYIRWAYKGLINAAVSLELKKRKRDFLVYKQVWLNFEKYKKYYDINEEIKKTAEFIENYKPF